MVNDTLGGNDLSDGGGGGGAHVTMAAAAAAAATGGEGGRGPQNGLVAAAFAVAPIQNAV